MPKVVKEDIDALNKVLSVTIEKGDYEAKFNKELNKLKEKAAIRGFRKGKTPLSFLKKMYGKNLLGEIVTDMLQHEINEILQQDEMDIIGQPIPSEDYRHVNFDYNKLEDYIFKFDIGMAPEYELKGLDKSTEIEIFQVEMPASKVEERLDYIRKQKGERLETDEPIEENDMLQFSAVEMEGDAPKADGWKTVFSVLYDKIADGAVKEELKGKKKGDTIRFNIFEMEENVSEEHVKKYLLNFTEADIEEGTVTNEMYEGTLQSVTRLKLAELTQEVLDQVFGEGVVNGLEEAKAKLAENLAAPYSTRVNSILYQQMRDHLMALHREAMPLPEAFLKRWLVVSKEAEAERFINNFEVFSEDLRWNLLRNKLYKRYDFKVEENDIVQHAYDKVSGYFGGYYDQKMMEPIVQRMLENEESVNNLALEILTDRLFSTLKDTFTLKNVPISEEDFLEHYQEWNAEQDRRAKLTGVPGDEEISFEEE